MEVSDRLYPRGKSYWYTLEMWPDGPQSRSGRGGEEKKIPLLPLPEILTAFNNFYSIR